MESAWALPGFDGCSHESIGTFRCSLFSTAAGSVSCALVDEIPPSTWFCSPSLASDRGRNACCISSSCILRPIYPTLGSLPIKLLGQSPDRRSNKHFAAFSILQSGSCFLD